MLSLPLGSVVSFAGDLLHGNTAYQLSLAGWLPCDGRLLDVSDYAPLFNMIGTAHGGLEAAPGVRKQFRLPNLNGKFVRGVNGDASRHPPPAPATPGPPPWDPQPPPPQKDTRVDPDVGARTAPPETQLANSGNAVGSYQKFATGRPQSVFLTDRAPDHVHTISNVTTDSHQTDWENQDYVAVQPYTAAPIIPAGAHLHAVGGGDDETCPVNMAVSWIIRAASPESAASTAAPIGTLVAFAGELTDVLLGELTSMGWVRCDGRSYPTQSEFSGLLDLIGKAFGGDGSTFHVPDLRGRFIRGIDHGKGVDPEAAMRSSQHDGGNSGDAVGSEQDWSTGRPANAFVAEPAGAHSHDAPHAPISGVEVSRASQQGRDSERLGGGSYVGTTSPAGAHSHFIVGGDRETHPTNIYLHWLIKFKDV